MNRNQTIKSLPPVGKDLLLGNGARVRLRLRREWMESDDPNGPGRLAILAYTPYGTVRCPELEQDVVRAGFCRATAALALAELIVGHDSPDVALIAGGLEELINLEP